MAEQVEHEVPPALDGERVDKIVAVLLEVTRATAARVVEAGVTVDGMEARASDRASVGQVIRCSVPPERASLAPEPVDFGVLYEDQDVVVVDKPPGVTVHPGARRQTGTLAAGLLHRYPQIEGVGDPGRWGLVHRLDRDTSGVLLVALTNPAFADLRAKLRRREIGRAYVALVEGALSAPTGTVDAPIGRDPAVPTRRAVLPTGKAARTHFEVTGYNPSSDVSLLRVRLETGRTHQIRVHLAAIGHPIAGDKTYGSQRRDLEVPRVFLHAASLEFHHPRTDEMTHVAAPLPADLTAVLDRLGFTA